MSRLGSLVVVLFFLLRRSVSWGVSVNIQAVQASLIVVMDSGLIPVLIFLLSTLVDFTLCRFGFLDNVFDSFDSLHRGDAGWDEMRC